MIFAAAPRRWVFLAADALRGGRVRAHLEDLAETMTSARSNRDRREARLRAVLHHAARTVPFYRDCDPGLGLAGFPIVDRQVIKARYDDFRSGEHPIETLMPKPTSGSSGEPLTMLLSREKRARQIAEYIHFTGLAGYRFGMRHTHIRAGTKSLLPRLLQNQVHLDGRRLSVDVFERWRRIARRGKAKVWIGTPTPLQMFAAYCASKGDRPADFRRLRGIVTIGETLVPVARERISRVFGIEPLSRYACHELGVVAHELPGTTRHQVNSSGYHVEILRPEADEPVEPGEIGRVVVTDLLGDGMPLIRYDLGDLAVPSEEMDALGVPMLDRIEGRTCDMLTDVEGEVVSSFSVGFFMRVWDEVARYQFLQEGPARYRLLVVPGAGYRDGAEIRAGLEEIFGGPVPIEEVEGIPRLPSGKHVSVRALHRETWPED